MKAVFFSYQSWTDEKFNRSLIKKCLKASIDLVNNNLKFIGLYYDDVGSVVNGGSVEINKEVEDKIKKAGIVVLDVTNVFKEERKSPNPNVLFECGYSFSKKGYKRCILVCNTAYGNIEDVLPFDIKNHFCVSYYCSSTQDIKKAANTLKSNLENILLKIISENLNLN